MTNTTFRLVFAVTWLVLGTGLLLRNQIGLQGLDNDARNLTAMGWVSLVFGGWHLARWYRDRARVVNPIAIIRGEHPPKDPNAPKEYLPEFDFTKQPTETPK